MKTFYEMMEMLNTPPDSYWNPPKDHEPYFIGVMLGDDDDEEFSVEVDYSDGAWETRGSLLARNYIMDGSEPLTSNAHQLDKGVEFENPGKRLENLPASLKSKAEAWVGKNVESHLDYLEKHR